MASGSPDWWIRTKTDIVAQTIANLDVDIIAQTLANLNVDIIAQTLANLKVDINAQTLAQVNIDIIAQTLANLNVDIAAQTIGNLAVDLNAQTIGNLAIDINAQTIDNLTFDIVKQTLSFLTVRPAYGSAITNESNDTLIQDEENELFRIPGQGILLDLSTWQIAGAAGPNVITIIKVDDAVAVENFFGELFTHGHFGNTDYIVGLDKYDPTNKAYTLSLKKPLTFETSIGVYGMSHYIPNQEIYWSAIYALTP